MCLLLQEGAECGGRVEGGAEGEMDPKVVVQTGRLLNVREYERLPKNRAAAVCLSADRKRSRVRNWMSSGGYTCLAYLKTCIDQK